MLPLIFVLVIVHRRRIILCVSRTLCVPSPWYSKIKNLILSERYLMGRNLKRGYLLMPRRFYREVRKRSRRVPDPLSSSQVTTAAQIAQATQITTAAQIAQANQFTMRAATLESRSYQLLVTELGAPEVGAADLSPIYPAVCLTN